MTLKLLREISCWSWGRQVSSVWDKLCILIDWLLVAFTIFNGICSRLQMFKRVFVFTSCIHVYCIGGNATAPMHEVIKTWVVKIEETKMKMSIKSPRWRKVACKLLIVHSGHLKAVKSSPVYMAQYIALKRQMVPRIYKKYSNCEFGLCSIAHLKEAWYMLKHIYSNHPC